MYLKLTIALATLSTSCRGRVERSGDEGVPVGIQRGQQTQDHNDLHDFDEFVPTRRPDRVPPPQATEILVAGKLGRAQGDMPITPFLRDVNNTDTTIVNPSAIPSATDDDTTWKPINREEDDVTWKPIWREVQEDDTTWKPINGEEEDTVTWRPIWKEVNKDDDTTWKPINRAEDDTTWKPINGEEDAVSPSLGGSKKGELAEDDTTWKPINREEDSVTWKPIWREASDDENTWKLVERAREILKALVSRLVSDAVLSETILA